MASRKVTVLFFPPGGRTVRQIEISKLVFLLLSLLALSGALLLAAVILDYITIKKDVPGFAHLNRQNKQQKEQLTTLAREIEEIGRSLNELKRLDDKLRTMVNLETREDRTQFLGIGGSEPLSLGSGMANESGQRRLVQMMHQSLGGMKSEISVQKSEKLELFSILETRKSTLACTPSIWPARGWVSSSFGNRISPFTNEKEFHAGMDISAKSNSPILAPADGTVLKTGSDYGYGRFIQISHGYGLKTIYGHLSKILVKTGQRVKRGQEIGMVGSSGRSTGPHLHYEVHVNNLPVNPHRYILN